MSTKQSVVGSIPTIILLRLVYASVAQLVEQRTENPRVGGSTPPGSTKSGIRHLQKKLIKRPVNGDPHHYTLAKRFEDGSFVVLFICVPPIYIIKTDVAAGNVPFLYMLKYIETKTITARESFYI